MKTSLEAIIAWGEMIVSAALAQKKHTCQWIDPSKIVSGRDPRFLQQSLMEDSLSLMATVMGSGGISTTPTKMLISPVTHIFAPPSMREDGLSDCQI
jgi:hypothetical protein